MYRGLQHTIDSLYWTRALGGCRTTRDTESMIRAAGFHFTSLEHGFHSSSLLTITSAPYILAWGSKSLSWSLVGHAAALYSLRSPPKSWRRSMRSVDARAAGAERGSGGWSESERCGRCRLKWAT